MAGSREGVARSPACEEHCRAVCGGLKDKLCVWGGLVPCVVVGGGVVEFVPGDCVAPSGETSLGDV